jgi:methyl-accepting chemotaxis protein
MKSFLDLSVRAKLFFVLGALLAIFALAITVAYSGILSLLEAQQDVRQKQVNETEFARVLANHNEARVATLMLLSGADRAEFPRWTERISKAHAENGKLLARLAERNTGSPRFMEKLREHNTIRERFTAVRDEAVELATSGKIAEARHMSVVDNAPRYDRMRDIIYELVADADVAVIAALENSREIARETRTVLIWSGLGLILLSGAGLFAAGRYIATPLQEIVAVARRVSGGDFTVEVPMKKRGDEVGAIARAVDEMIGNFRTVHREIREGANVLATSAAEIFTATAQMAASATETATAVSQTTSTAEEVKQTAQVSAQKAGNVADIAQRAAQAAQNGRKAIDESVAGMSHVREQMELIAETVVRLSEQSQAIGEIISSVNDLAEQSNLLAVNASIEAAKAGEHGRGFAVVAQEIRNLANQSKESTAQIRTILNDVQRATTATVMAAEQGSKAVDTGVKQVNQSGDAIRTLAESIVAAAQAATQITASTQEQLIGIDQVTIAIQNILQASKQNATGSQQAEAGAKNLNTLGQNLKALVQRFAV